jgi:protein ImuB
VERVSNGFACVWVPYFAAAALERCEPAVRERALAVVTGAPPTTRVVDANAAAREAGVRPGMPDAEAGARCPGLVRRPVAEEAMVSARHALLESALAVSPRIEDGGPGLVYVDIAGLARLLGPPGSIARHLAHRAREVGLSARVAVASTRTVARLAALTGAGAAGADASITIVAPGRERPALVSVPLAALELPPELTEALQRWGIATLGELATLPRDGLAMRLGPAGLRAHDLAYGREEGPFRPYTPPPFWEEALGLDWELDSLEALAPIVDAVLQRLTARLDTAHLMADALVVRLQLARGGRHERAIALASPMREVKPMLTLIGLELEAHPPPEPVVGVAISVRPLPQRAEQGGLWQPPPPAPRDLAAVLARLAALVGPGNVGATVLEESHRPDAFALTVFAPPASEACFRETPSTAMPSPTLVMRRLRPPRRIGVETDGERPARVDLGAGGGPGMRVRTCAGPWRISGEWWDARGWARDEWDVALTDSTLCRLARNRLTGDWYLDGVYD